MTEFGLVEKPILDWLTGLGWTYRAADAMEPYGRELTDPLVEGLLLPAVLRINEAVQTEEQARRAISALRQVMARPDLLDANRAMLDALRDGLPVVLAPGQDAMTVLFIQYDPAKMSDNDFTVTNQYAVKGTKMCKADTVLLVNGIPLVVAEYKSYLASNHDWAEGVRQVHRYQREAPALLTANLFCVAADEQCFRYGTVAFDNDSEADVSAQREHWHPWLSQYPVRPLYWTLPETEQDDDPVRAAAIGLLRPDNLLDFLEHFVVFETSKGRTVKKIARYQQFEAANDIVNRVLEGKYKDGLIWHTQGSGKSLTMVFAAYKLRRRPKLQNPTVFIVVDRSDLKTQIADDFENCNYPNIMRAMGVRDLKSKIRHDRRETIVTTIQCFQGMGDLTPNTRDNIIILLDEAHRSQQGGRLRGGKDEVAGFAMTMRAKLPGAFRFGLTGTPIDRTMINTHRLFGPIIDGEQERYLSYYGIRQSIKDGATLEVFYEPHYVPVCVDEEPLNVNFEQMCDEMEVYDEETKDQLQRKEARWKALVKDERRIQTVVTHLVHHFLAHPDPSGFKAQLVTVDREACVLYKKALDAAFTELGFPADWTEVVISEAQNDPSAMERFHYTREKIKGIIDRFKMTRAQWERWNSESHGAYPSQQWTPELKILIVCDRLLTGFDAPVEQVMYLDKPLRDHNLLQAMARTNRPLSELGKCNGLIIDYFGVFNDLQKALNFDEGIREEAVINWEKLKEQVPMEVGHCLAFFHGIRRDGSRESLFACLRRLVNPEIALQFEAQFKRTQVLWEAISPDECLYPYRHDYAWICSVYIAHRRRNRREQVSYEALAAKTREMIQKYTEFKGIVEMVPVYRIDDKYLTQVKELPTPQDRAAELEAALNRELVDGGGGFLYKKLGERLKRTIEQKEKDDQLALCLLEELVDEINAAKHEPERLGLTAPGEYPLYQVILAFSAVQDEALCVRAAKLFITILRDNHYLPAGWAENIGGRKKVATMLKVISWDPEIIALGLCPDTLSDPPFQLAAIEELARVLP